MAQLEDLKRQAERQAAAEADIITTTTVEAESSPLDDLETALGLLRQAHIMLSLVSDPDLCKVVSKRERATMTKLSSRIGSFVGEIEMALSMEGYLYE
jgi:hypothetical protein